MVRPTTKFSNRIVSELDGNFPSLMFKREKKKKNTEAMKPFSFSRLNDCNSFDIFDA